MMPSPLFLPRSRIALIVGSLLLSSVDANQVRAQDGATLPPAVARHMAASDRIQLDGLLDEAVWQAAPVSSGFRQQEPDEGAPATERTEVRVVYDEATLYVGITAYDSDPDAVIARVLQRDRVMQGAGFGRFNFTTDDGVAILFDTFHDHRNAMVFATNPNGAEFDALISDEGGEVNVDWRGVWRVAAKRTADGWSAEFAIPFRTLRYPSDAAAATWGQRVPQHPPQERGRAMALLVAEQRGV